MYKDKNGVFYDERDFPDGGIIDAAFKLHEDDRERLVEIAGEKNLHKNIKKIKTCLIDLALKVSADKETICISFPVIGSDEYFIFAQMEYKMGMVVTTNRIKFWKKADLEYFSRIPGVEVVG